MNRKILLLALLTALASTSCDKLKALTGRKKAEPTPPPVAVAAEPTAPTAPTTAGSAKPATTAETEKPARPIVDAKAQVIVLCYHRLEGKAGGALSIEPATFEKQMEEIKQSGDTVISMQDFLAWRRGEKNIPPKSILITIDDGYVSGYAVGWPVLKKYGYPFTMFVYLNYIGTGGKAITWEQLAEMRDAGVEIGCHTVSHLDLRRKPAKWAGDYDSWLNDEIVRSKKVIEDRLGIQVATIAYPFGLHNQKVNDAVKAAGYEAAFTTYGQRLGISTNLTTLGRYDVTTKDAQGHDSFSIALSFQGMMAPGGDPVMGQDAAASMVTQPMNNELITNPIPTLKANLATMGPLDEGSVAMRISGRGLVNAQFDPVSKNLSYTVQQPLKPGFYTVIIGAKSNGRPLETRWNFSFNPAGAPPLPEPTVPPKAMAPAAKKKK